MSWLPLLGLLGWALPLCAQAPRITAAMHLEARVAERAVIEELCSQQLLAVDPAAVQALVLIDLDGDGFGDGDLLRLEPGGETLPLRPLSPALRARLQGWGFSANQELAAPLDISPQVLRDSGRPVAGLLADLLEATRRHLGRGAVELALDARPEGLLLRVWDFEGDSLFRRAGVGGERILDVAQILREDTTFIVDRVLRDLLIIESSVVDTVWLEPRRP
jgi:hypothetical protein